MHLSSRPSPEFQAAWSIAWASQMTLAAHPARPSRRSASSCGMYRSAGGLSGTPVRQRCLVFGVP